MAKCGNQKTRTPDGVFHDSKKEAARWIELKFLEKVGTIKDLRRQVEFPLIPVQREKSTEVYIRGAKKGQPKDGKVIELPVVYIADFVYTDTKTGEMVVEDVKGYRDPSSAVYAKFVLKRKMMLYFHNIRIKEI